MSSLPDFAPKDQRPLPKILAELRDQEVTGALSVVSTDVRRELVFEAGFIRATRSDRHDEHLGEWLTQRGRLGAEEVALALLAQAGDPSVLLGRLLLDRDLIDGPTLVHEVEALSKTIVRRATSAVRDHLEFHPGGRAGGGELPDRATARLILAAARELPQNGEISQLMSSGRRWRLNGSSEDIARDLDPTEEELRALGSFGSGADLDQVIRDTELDRVRLGALVAPFVLCGALVEINGNRAERARLSNSELAERAAIVSFHTRAPSGDHYAMLGIPRGSSYTTIEQAWERQRAFFDPGRAAREGHLADLGEALEQASEKLRMAYQTLFDPSSRVRYDRVRPADRRPVPRVDTTSEGDSATQSQDIARREIVGANLRRAEEALRAGDRHTAYTLLEAACNLDPQPVPLLTLARLMLANPMWSERALARLKQALELDPGMVDGWLELASFWRRRRNVDRERRALQLALTADPDDERAAERLTELDGDKRVRRLRTMARNPNL